MYNITRASMSLKGTLPVLILHSLQALPKHGYRIAQNIREKPEGVLDFKEGTLYPTLHNLEEKGFVESFTETERGRVRCYYRLMNPLPSPASGQARRPGFEKQIPSSSRTEHLSLGAPDERDLSLTGLEPEAAQPSANPPTCCFRLSHRRG